MMDMDSKKRRFRRNPKEPLPLLGFGSSSIFMNGEDIIEITPKTMTVRTAQRQLPGAYSGELRCRRTGC